MTAPTSSHQRSLALLLVAGFVAAIATAAAISGSGVAGDRGAAADVGKKPIPAEHVGLATFGSGCFWCTESDFDKIDGVVKTISGYMGGSTKNPTYKSVSTGRTGHAEVLQITFDRRKVDYQTLLNRYWRTTDIVDGGGQFCDRGSQYRPVIFTHSQNQAALAKADKKKLTQSGRFSKPIAVEIAPAKTFTAAQAYHQDYYLKNPTRYKFYRSGCRRDARLRALWGQDAIN